MYFALGSTTSKHILAHFSTPKFILTSLLIVFTIFISFSKSSSVLPSSFNSSICYKWVIFLSVLCTGYTQSVLFSSFVNGICAIQNSNGKRKPSWNIPLRIWMGFFCTTFCFVFKLSLVFHFSIDTRIIYNFIVYFYYLHWLFYPAMWNAFKCFLVTSPGYI